MYKIRKRVQKCMLYESHRPTLLDTTDHILLDAFCDSLHPRTTDQNENMLDHHLLLGGADLPVV
jgi:hypothetical protein